MIRFRMDEENGEDAAVDVSWNYTDIIWNGAQAEKIQRAFEKRLAICMTCGRG